MGKGKTPPGSRKKTTKSHTTAIPLVEKLLKALNRMAEVDKISLGIIKPKLRAGIRRLKIMTQNEKTLLLKVRDTNSLQEVRVYTSAPETTQENIADWAQNHGLRITK